MNSSFNAETDKSKEIMKKSNTKSEIISSKDFNKSSNIIKSLKRYKKYYKKKIPKEKYKYENIAYNNLISKYNYTPNKYNLLCVYNLLNNTYCHLVSEFKEKMILDYVDEFFKRNYNIKEIKERIPKLYLYYKHYSIFFGQPFFKNFKFNKLIQKNGEKKARIYYKNHYQNGESKDEGNENLGFAQSESANENENEKSNKLNNNKKKNVSHIFDRSIKENIDNVTLMTTINSIENNTINLKLNNEKIEIFSENKNDKSNDTTLGEIINYINKKDLEEKKQKNKIIKKKNISLGGDIKNLLNKNSKKLYINENNKEKLFELINKNTNNSKRKIKVSSIKKNFIKNQYTMNYNTHTQRTLINSKNKINEERNRKKIISNKNLNSNRIYKKVKLLSLEDDEISNLLNSNMIKSPRYKINMNINKINKTKKNVMISNNYPNKYISKIKISKTLKDIKERNNNIRNITSGKKDKIKLELINLTESQIVKDKKNKKIKTRNYISPMNKINTYNNKMNIKNMKNIHINNNKKIFLENLSYQTINYDRGLTHQRTKSNNIDNPLIFSKCLITDRYKIYTKPFIRINKKIKAKKDISNINNEIKTSINENYNSLINQKISYNNINDLKNNNINKEQYKKKISINNYNYNKKSNFGKYIIDAIKNSKIKNHKIINKGNNKDIIQMALSLMNNQKNLKKNYNLNININNEININENNNINNSTYSINNYTQRINSKNNNNKNMTNLVQNKNINNIKETTINSYRNNYPSLKKKINFNNIKINKKEGKKIRKRNIESNINEALTSINNNLVNSIIINNSLENNKANSKNKKIVKKYHTKSITSLIDLMNHNKRLISLYRNLNKSK